MNNYYEFNKLIEDNESFEYFSSLSTNNLKNILNECFNNIDAYLTFYSSVFKDIFNGSDYDEFYYSCLALVEELNDIKIILNILKVKND